MWLCEPDYPYSKVNYYLLQHFLLDVCDFNKVSVVHYGLHMNHRPLFNKVMLLVCIVCVVLIWLFLEHNPKVQLSLCRRRQRAEPAFNSQGYKHRVDMYVRLA